MYKYIYFLTSERKFNYAITFAQLQQSKESN